MGERGRHRRSRVLGGVAAVALVAAGTIVLAPAAAALTEAEQLARETPPALHELDPYRLDEVTLAGGHNTYNKKGVGNDEVANDISGDDNQLVDALRTVQVVEIDVWTAGNGHFYVEHTPTFAEPWGDNNDNNCGKGGDYTAPRNQDLYSCLEGLRHWHDRHPDHPLVVIKLELKNGFQYDTPQELESAFRFSDVNLAPLLFTPADLMCKDRPACRTSYPSPEAAAQAGNWPTLGSLRGKFMVSIVSGAFALSAPGFAPSSVPGGSAESNYLANVAVWEYNAWKDLAVWAGTKLVQAWLGHDDAPVTYAKAMVHHDVSGLFFPALLMKKADIVHDGDPRRRDYPSQSQFADPAVASTVVLFDMESGYLPAVSGRPYGSGAITADTLTWVRANRFLSFVSTGEPAQPCGAGDSACRQRLVTAMCPPGPSQATCAAEWNRADPSKQVDLARGRMYVADIAGDFGFNFVETDQERLGLVEPRPLSGLTDSSFERGLDGWTRPDTRTNLARYDRAADAHSGTHFLATNTTAPDGRLFRDVDMILGPGDAATAGAWLRAQDVDATGRWCLVATGALAPGTPVAADETTCTRFRVTKDRYQYVEVALSPTATHRTLRLQLQPDVGGGTTFLDSVSLQRGPASSFEDGVGAWTVTAGASGTVAADPNLAHDGTHEAIAWATAAGGALQRDVALPVVSGDGVVASAWVRASGAASGGQWCATAGATTTCTRFTATADTWRPVSVVLDAGTASPTVRVGLLPTPGAGAVVVDTVSVQRSLLRNGSFERGNEAWSPTPLPATSAPVHDGGRALASPVGASAYEDLLAPLDADDTVFVTAWARALGTAPATVYVCAVTGLAETGMESACQHAAVGTADFERVQLAVPAPGPRSSVRVLVLGGDRIAVDTVSVAVERASGPVPFV